MGKGRKRGVSVSITWKLVRRSYFAMWFPDRSKHIRISFSKVKILSPGAAAHHSTGGTHSLTWEEQTVFPGGQSNIGTAASSLSRVGFFLSYMVDMERNNTKKENNPS